MHDAGAKSLTCIDLFAGCGGLSLGLEQAGFRPLLFSELNPSASETYVENRRGLGMARYGDIHDLTNAKLRQHLKEWRSGGVAKVDLVCGGPPCQGFSGIGHRRSYSVAREEIPSNHLYQEMIRVVRAVQPRLFLFENVRGLLNGRWRPDGMKGEIWRDVQEAFGSIKGYSVRWSLVQAKDYGVPQNRPRVLLVGVRDGVVPAGSLVDSEDAVRAGLLPAPDPSERAPSLREVFGDLMDPRYEPGFTATESYPADATCEFQREMRARTGREEGATVTEQVYSRHSERVVEKFAHMLANDGEIPEHLRTKKFAQRLLKPEWGAEGPNITATSLPDDFVHFAQPRSPTVREWARLQTFPDDYQFRGPRTTGGTRRAGVPTDGIWDREVPRYTQIGNAVPVRLARAVGEHFAKLLSRAAGSSQRRFSEQHALVGE